MANFIKTLIWRMAPKKIYGLVGSAGSGKSFRAFLIADKYKIEYIIDDGLLIKDQKIIAGTSAKKELLKIKAVKRAIFQETKHAREVRKTLYREMYNSLLIIGTSEEMITKIVERLHLPKPNKIIKIEEIATEEEIKNAQKARLKHGKHVMPIPLIEVKKRYPNLVLHAIHFFIDEPKGFFFKKNKKKLIEKTIVRPSYGDNGSISITETALVQMVGHCLAEYSSNIRLLKVMVIEIDDGYNLDLKLSLDYNYYNAKVIKDIQSIIRTKIEEFTGMTINKVNINIIEIRHA